MKAKHFALFGSLAVVAACAVLQQTATAGKKDPVAAGPASHEARIVVDPSEKIGKLPKIYRAGSYLWFLPDPPTEKALDKYLLEQKVGTIGILLDSVLESSKSLEDLSARLSQWDLIARKIDSRGGEVLIEIWGMPLWLSSNPSGKMDTGSYETKPIGVASPPRDYAEWSKVVYTIVDHFNNKLKLPCMYQIWMEPDLHWLGTEEEYLKLYKYSVLGARKADPKVRIGGPASASWDSKFLRVKGPLSGSPSTRNFIKYCSENSIPELGLNRLPIDFIVWHLYNADPFNPFTLAEPATIVRKWLAQYGYQSATPFIIGEWTIWQEKNGKHPYFSPEHDTEITASYIVAMLKAMQKAGIESHMFTTIFETQFTPREPEFTGNFGLFTKNKIVKPSYNAFRAISMLGKTSIATKVNDQFLTAIGTSDNDEIVIVIANFFPYGAMTDQILLIPATANPLPHARYGLAEILAASPIGREDFENLRLGKYPVDRLNLSNEMKTDLKSVISYINNNSVGYKSQEWRRSGGIKVTLEMTSLPLRGNVAYRRYVIDSRSANSHSALPKLEEYARKGVRDFNELPEVKLGPVEEKKADAKDLRTISFEMSPYSVHVVVLSK